MSEQPQETVTTVIMNIAFENAMLKLFLIERALGGEFAEWMNEKTIQYRTFDIKIAALREFMEYSSRQGFWKRLRFAVRIIFKAV